jgi:hypothetical protein
MRLSSFASHDQTGLGRGGGDQLFRPVLKPTRTLLAILAAAVAGLVVFHLVTREEYNDPARRQIQRENVTKP